MFHILKLITLETSENLDFLMFSGVKKKKRVKPTSAQRWKMTMKMFCKLMTKISFHKIISKKTKMKKENKEKYEKSDSLGAVWKLYRKFLKIPTEISMRLFFKFGEFYQI